MPIGYLVKLMKNGKVLAHRRVGAYVQCMDLGALMDMPGQYTATVTALGDGTRWRDSLPSEESEVCEVL